MGKLSKDDREMLRRMADGTATEADKRRYLVVDGMEQAMRDARAHGIRAARRRFPAIKTWNAYALANPGKIKTIRT